MQYVYQLLALNFCIIHGVSLSQLLKTYARILPWIVFEIFKFPPVSPAVPIELLIQGVFIITMTAKKYVFIKTFDKNIEKLLDYINISKSHALIN